MTVPELPSLPCERLQLEIMPKILGKTKVERALVISPGRAQIASHLLEQGAALSVTAWYLDLHQAGMAALAAHEAVQVECGADLPAGTFDLVAMPVMAKSEAELTRDLLQQAHGRLPEGGLLVASVDNPRDQWLHEQLQQMFDKVTCQRAKDGCVYWARKTAELKKVKNFDCQFAFRDEDGRLFQLFSRPGVFSHRRLDAGARQLMLSAEIENDDVVLDLGCGSGAVAVAAASKTTSSVLAVDSNARAIESTTRSAELNDLPNITPLLNADGQFETSTPIDLVLANPPYFGEGAIWQHFVDTALAVLRPGGALLVVNKKPRWYAEYFDGLLEDVAIFPSSRYHVACGRKPSPPT